MAQQQNVFTWADWSGGLSEDSYRGADNQFTGGKGINIFKNPFCIQLQARPSRPSDNAFDNVQEIGYASGSLYVINSGGNVAIFHNNNWRTVQGQGFTRFFFHYGREKQTVDGFDEYGYYYSISNTNLTARSYDLNTEIINKKIPGESYDKITAYIVVNGRLLLAKESVVYAYSFMGKAFMKDPVIDTLDKNEEIKKMFFFNDELIIFSRCFCDEGVGTNLYRFQAVAGRFEFSYKQTFPDVTITGAIQDNIRTFWTSDVGLYLTEGSQTQLFYKTTKFKSTNIKCFFEKNAILIYDKKSRKLYMFDRVFRGGEYALVDTGKEVLAATANRVVGFNQKIYLSNTSAVQDTGDIISNAFTGDISIKKELIGMQIGYSIPKQINKDRSAKIDVYILTNPRKNDTFVKIATIDNEDEQMINITANEIASAFEEKGIEPTGYDFKIKLVFTSGGKAIVDTDGKNVYTISPRVYRVDLFYKYIENAVPK